jgi:hypothetical protein
MAEYSAEQRAQIARARQVQQAYEDQLLDLPGVNAIGLSLKTVDGVRIPEFALVVHVTQKKPLAELPPGEQIPPEIEGVKTDVVVGGPFYAHAGVPSDSDQAKYRPVIGGSAISPDGRSPAGTQKFGTLGCVAVNQDPAITDPSKQYLLLTNSHVLFKAPSVTHTGEKVGQPDTCSVCSKCLDHTIAHMDHDGVLSGYPSGSPPGPGPWIDAAVATLDPQTKWVAAVIQSGEGSSYTTEPIAGTHPMDDNDVLFQLDANGTQQPVYAVHKRGAKTRDTKGWVISIHLTAHVIYQDEPSDNPLVLTFNEAIAVVPQTGFDVFGAEGDSGSVVLNDQSQVIGLEFGGTEGQTGPTAKSFVLPIAAVEAQLKVKVADSATYPGEQTVPNPPAGAHATPPAGAQAVPATPQPVGQLAQRFVQAEEDLRATVTGARLADTVRRDLPEIRSLVNTNRRVLVVWRRMDGPRWLEQGLRCLIDREQPFPAEFAGRSLADCAAAFSGILQEHGSARLAADAAWLGRLLPGFAGRSYEEMLALLRSRDDVAEPAALAGDR